MIRLHKDMLVDVRENMRGGAGKIQISHIFKKDELGGKCRLFAKITIQPGDSIGFHEHHDEEEVFYVISGNAAVDDAGTSKEVGPGDAILTGGGKGHAIENIGTTPLELVAVILLYN